MPPLSTTITDVSGLSAALAAKEATANKDQPSGYAGLDASGHIVGPIITRTGTAAAFDAIVGESGEVGKTTDTHDLRCFDGAVAGGFSTRRNVAVLPASNARPKTDTLYYKATGVGESPTIFAPAYAGVVVELYIYLTATESSFIALGDSTDVELRFVDSDLTYQTDHIFSLTGPAHGWLRLVSVPDHVNAGRFIWLCANRVGYTREFI